MEIVTDGCEFGGVFQMRIIGSDCCAFERQMAGCPEHHKIVHDGMACRVQDPKVLPETSRQHACVTDHNDEGGCKNESVCVRCVCGTGG